jgi:hypothetical protein
MKKIKILNLLLIKLMKLKICFNLEKKKVLKMKQIIKE